MAWGQEHRAWSREPCPVLHAPRKKIKQIYYPVAELVEAET